MSLSNRRRFLKGMGAAIGLPALESLAHPILTQAMDGKRAMATTATGAPLRMAYLYVPNGVNLDHWRPEGTGADYQLNKTFKPVEAFKKDFQIFSGFEQKHAFGGTDGAGDHARGGATFLTSSRALKTAGADVKIGTSIDQVAAQSIRGATRLSSLELSGDINRRVGSCDSGYACAYVHNISWRSETLPMAPEINPRAVFEKLFGSGSTHEREQNFQTRIAEQKSILDFINADVRAMNKNLSSKDRQKLDEYLTSVREIEQRIALTEKHGLAEWPEKEKPAGIPGKYRDHMDLMTDMMVLAFQTDSTRVASFMMAHEGSNRSFEDIGISEGHHSLSHHKGKDDNLEQIAQIDLFYMERLAYLLKRLDETKDEDGHSILHNSMIVYGSGISDGNRHNHDDLPIVLAGHAGGAFSAGQHHQFNSDIPLSNLYLRMLNEFGTPQERFADSTSHLTQA